MEKLVEIYIKIGTKGFPRVYIFDYCTQNQ